MLQTFTLASQFQSENFANVRWELYDLKLVRNLISPVVLVESPDTAGILDDVEDGGDDGDEELEDADHDDRLLEREAAHRGEAGSAPAHGCLSVCCV